MKYFIYNPKYKLLYRDRVPMWNQSSSDHFIQLSYIKMVASYDSVKNAKKSMVDVKNKFPFMKLKVIDIDSLMIISILSL